MTSWQHCIRLNASEYEQVTAHLEKSQAANYCDEYNNISAGIGDGRSSSKH